MPQSTDGVLVGVAFSEQIPTITVMALHQSAAFAGLCLGHKNKRQLRPPQASSFRTLIRRMIGESSSLSFSLFLSFHFLRATKLLSRDPIFDFLAGMTERTLKEKIALQILHHQNEVQAKDTQLTLLQRDLKESLEREVVSKKEAREAIAENATLTGVFSFWRKISKAEQKSSRFRTKQSSS